LGDRHGHLLGASLLENNLAFFDPKHITIPVAVSVFPDEIYAAPRTWTEQAYPNLIYFNKLDKGGHFAAWEQPTLFRRGTSRGLQTVARETADSGKMNHHLADKQTTTKTKTRKENI